MCQFISPWSTSTLRSLLFIHSFSLFPSLLSFFSLFFSRFAREVESRHRHERSRRARVSFCGRSFRRKMGFYSCRCRRTRSAASRERLCKVCRTLSPVCRKLRWNRADDFRHRADACRCVVLVDDDTRAVAREIALLGGRDETTIRKRVVFRVGVSVN